MSEINQSTDESPRLDKSDIVAGVKQPWQRPRMRVQDLTKGRPRLDAEVAEFVKHFRIRTPSAHFYYRELVTAIN